ncbi:MAG TPA: four helix bundle protein [Longimicrobiales bacterium]|nr:four helix bundle protein [Longimicrobiales bacterium]
MEYRFDHERLEVYRVAREFNGQLSGLLTRVQRGQAESRDNLARAGKSITRNIAEGAGKWTVKDKIHFYHIARASATECAAGLDELLDYGLASPEQIEPLKTTLGRIVAMLIAMIRSLESRKERTMDRAPTPSPRDPGNGQMQP